MTSSAALSAAALRVLRTAAGRRALQVVVLVGGLFALGFLCGERASAAEGLPTATPVTSVAPAAPAVPVAPTASLSDLTDGGVVEKVVQPVGDLVETVTDELAEVPENVPPLSSLPSLPSVPSAPEVPVIPELPAQTLPAPVAEAPRPDSPAQGSTGDHGSGTGHSSADGHRSGKAAEAARAVVGDYGPPSVTGPLTTGTSARAHGHGVAASAGYVPVRQAPTGDQGWALGHRPGVDNSSSRHGDAQAVSLNDLASLRLVPGGIARTDADGTRDRDRDIPVSPA